MIYAADDDMIWCVWPDGAYCSEDELDEVLGSRSDDFMRVSAVAYTACGEPLFDCGNSHSACEIRPIADFNLCGNSRSATLASRACFFSDADYLVYLLNAAADRALSRFNAHIAAKAKPDSE
jgi:hypothetical protein